MFFDGKDFKIFRHIPQDSTSLGNNNVRTVFEDKEQNLWIGTNRGVYIFNPQKEIFKFFDYKTEDGVLISSNVYDIQQSINGSIWIATFGQGLFIYNPVVKTLVQNTQYSSFIKSIATSETGNMYISTRQEGIFCLDSTGILKYSFLTDPHSADQNNEINALYYHRDTLWFSLGTNNLKMLDLKTHKIRTYSSQMDKTNVTNIRSILVFSATELLLGADNGLYLFNRPNGKFSRLDDPSNPKSLSDQSILNIFKDREEGIWISTNLGGVNYLPPNLKPFQSYFPRFQSGSISGKAISEFCEDPQGNIWIATEDGGLNYLNTQTGKIKTYQPGKSGISYHNIRALLLDGQQLWIGTFSRGLDILDLKTGQVKNFRHTRHDIRTISDNSIFSIYKTRDGTILIGTAWGLNRYHPETQDFSLIDDVGTYSHIYDIQEDSRDNLWIATYNTGLFQFHYPTQSWTHYNYTPEQTGSVTSNSIITIFEDSRKNIWFGTEGSGLCTFDYETETFSSFDLDNQLLLNPVIYAIEEDRSGNLWIAGNAGLLCINPQNRKGKLYTQADGLQSNQFNFHSSLHAHDDKLYFGGINGFNSFYPEEFRENTYIPKIVITRFSLFNQEINPNTPHTPLQQSIIQTNEISLPYDQNTFSFTFAALSYQAPAKNQYAYMLEGADKEWIYTDSKNEASYTDLQPGSYVFHVKGSNNDGHWNDQGVSIQITIHPPFWKSNWAYASYLLLFLFFAGISLRHWSKRVQKRHEALLKQYRQQQEKETYQSKINFFTQVAHEIRTPLSLIKMPLESILQSGDGNEATRKYLKTMDKNTERLLDLVNQLLDFRKAETNEFKLKLKKQNLNELIQNIVNRFIPATQLKNITLETQMPEIPYFGCADEEALTKIISNLLSNALKYTQDHIQITLQGEKEYFEIRVSDNGQAFPAASGNGSSKSFTRQKTVAAVPVSDCL